MMYQEPYDFIFPSIEAILGMIIPIALSFILIYVMIRLYRKLRIFLLIFLVYLCSLYIVFITLADPLIPYNNAIQGILLSINSLIFGLTCYSLYKSIKEDTQ